MPPLVRRLADFVHDLQQIERTSGRGEAILDAFTRHTAFVGGGRYLCEPRDSKLRLAARTPQYVAAEILDEEIPADLIATFGQVLVPLRAGRGHLGLVKLTGETAPSKDG